MYPRASVIDGNFCAIDLSALHLATVAASADATICLKDQNRVSEMDQLLRGGETGEPGPEDNHVVAAGFVAVSAADRPWWLQCGLGLCRRAQGKAELCEAAQIPFWQADLLTGY